jgi:hypothetical protein
MKKHNSPLLTFIGGFFFLAMALLEYMQKTDYLHSLYLAVVVFVGAAIQFLFIKARKNKG